MVTLDHLYWNEAPLQRETTDFVSWLKQQALFPYELYQHQLDMISFVCNNKRSILRCARQMGTTTAMLLWALYQAYQHGKKVFVVNKDTMMARASMRCLLQWVESSAIGHDVTHNTKHRSVTFKDEKTHHGFIRWCAVSEKTRLQDYNRGFSNTLVIFDNVSDFRPCDDANALAHTCNRSIVINPNSHTFANHNTARFPWHLRYSIEFKQRMIDTMGIELWNKEYECNG